MKRMSPLSVALVTALVTSIICLVITFVITESTRPVAIGDTVTEKVTDTTVSTNDSEATDANTAPEGDAIITYVYLGASSKLYTNEEAKEPLCMFLELFDDDELAELIDHGNFPFKQQYVAITTSANPVRYKIKTESGSTYWVEP